MIQFLHRFTITLCACCLLGACQQAEKSPYRVGAIYSVSDGNGGYYVSKILKNDDKNLFIALLKERHVTRPGYVNNQQIAAIIADNEIQDVVDFILLSTAQFKLKSPRMIAIDKVSEAELRRFTDAME